MLGMVLGFLGSAFAPAIAGATGIAALASPLLSGAIGSGIGTAVETGDLKAGLKAGLGSYVGGRLVGGLMGDQTGALAGQGTMGSGANAMTTGTPLNLNQGVGALMPPTAPMASNGLFGSGAIGQGISRGMQFAQSPTGIGALMGMSLAQPAPTMEVSPSSSGEGPPNMPGVERPLQNAPEGYRPGIDPEWDYGISTPYTFDQLARYRDSGVLPYASGGEIKKPNEKTEIVEAVSAIKGMHPQPEVALGKFLAKYGEEALRDLVDSVSSGEFDETRERFANGEKGVVRGPGDGTGVDDKVPATIDGGQDVLLSDGEFVLRKDTTDALEKRYGGGFLSAVNDAGEKAPEVLKRRAA